MAARLNRCRTAVPAVLGILLSATIGCQTHYSGMTLPSPRYLEHPPQYFPEEPDFPLTRELATQELTARQFGGDRAGAAGVKGGPVPPR